MSWKLTRNVPKMSRKAHKGPHPPLPSNGLSSNLKMLNTSAQVETIWPENCHETSRKCSEKHTKAHILSTIQWIELKLENVKHTSTYLTNT